MSEKSRMPRKPAHRAGVSTEHPLQAAEQALRDDATNDASVAALRAELAKTRQELDKALKISRPLARTCARAEQETRRRDETFTLLGRYGSDLVFRLSRDGRIQEISAASLE